MSSVALTAPHPIQTHGSFFGTSHWRQIAYQQEGNGTLGWVDLSATDAHGNHPIFIRKNPLESLFISLICSGVLPLILALCMTQGGSTLFGCSQATFLLGAAFAIPAFYASMVLTYHALRAMTLAIYLLGHSLFLKDIEANIETREQLKERIKHSLRGMALAIPGAIAHTLAHIATVLDPTQWTHGDALNGRKLVALVDLYWNQGVPLDQGFWSVGGPQRRCYTAPSAAFFLAGCYQPISWLPSNQAVLNQPTYWHPSSPTSSDNAPPPQITVSTQGGRERPATLREFGPLQTCQCLRA